MVEPAARAMRAGALDSASTPAREATLSQHRYVIVGGGIAAASAIEGIRAHDRDGGILMLTRENHAPYQRPLLSKDVWFDAEAVTRLPVHDDVFYAQHGVEIAYRREVVELDVENHAVDDERGERHGYEKLLLATGSRARRFDVPGGDTSAVGHFRDLEDYFGLANRLEHLQHVTVHGGGPRSIELAAALRHRGVDVTLMYPEEYPLHDLLPREVGPALSRLIREHGIETVTSDRVMEIENYPGMIHARTYRGHELSTEMLLVESGATPQIELAEAAGLATDDGILVDEFAEASHPGVYAAGDVTEFPYLALGQLMHVECADHALHHGRAAGANMAGAATPYDWMPAPWFQIFDLRIDLVGEVGSRLMDMQIVWTEFPREGLIFYTRDDVIRGVMLCNLTGRLDWARGLIRAGQPMSPADREAQAAQPQV